MRVIWAALAVTQVAATPFDPTRHSSGDGDLLIFVGEQVYSEEVDRSNIQRAEDGSDDIIILMDSKWRSRFQVHDILHGEYENRLIDFIAYDHSGTPRYSRHDGLMVMYLHDTENGFIHQKYLFNAVWPTQDGGYATCGQPLLEEDPLFDPPNIKPVTFDPPAAVNVSKLKDATVRSWQEADEPLTDEDQSELDLTLAEIDEKYQPPVYQRTGGEASCQMGIDVETLANYHLNTIFRYRMIETFCRNQYPPNKHAPFEQQDSLRDQRHQCYASLKQSGWPYDMTLD